MKEKIALTLMFGFGCLSYNSLNAQSVLQKALKGKNKEPQEVKQEEVKKPEKPMAVLPTTVYTDNLEISGIYYLSKEVKSEAYILDDRGYASISDPRYFSQVNLQFVEETGALNIHFHEGSYAPMKAWLNAMLVKLYKQGNLGDYFGFEVDNNNKTNEFRGGINVLEKDVFIISTSGKYSSDTRLDCSSCKLIISKDEAGNENFKREDAYLILGKDKNRVAELMNNPKMVDSLKVISEIGICEAYNIARAASNVLPVEGLKDAKLKAEATAFAKQEVIANNRTTEKIEYAYIKSKDWIIVRNQSTGLIVKRTLNVITTVKIGEKCFYMNGVMYQLYDGANYGKSQWAGNGAPLATECTNLLKYK